jgi:putative protein-disulfide isomerase
MSLDWLTSKSNALIYIGDPLCSWCYGIAPELDLLKDQLKDVDFHMIMGGLRPFNTEKAIDMPDFLRAHWVEIEQRTAQPFSFDILHNPDFIYDTEPPSRAAIVVRRMKPTLELDFFKAVQRAFYFENKDTNEIETYLELAKEFGLDVHAFERLYVSDVIKTETKNDFQLSQELKIRGFPSIVYKKGSDFHLVANGFDTAENIKNRIQKLR